MFPEQNRYTIQTESVGYREAVSKDIGVILAEYLLLQENPTLLLDMDGVVLEADSLDEPTLSTIDLVPRLQKLESLGISIGTATARGLHVIGFLREQGLHIHGPKILEEGQVIIQNGTARYIEQPGHRAFIHHMKEAMEKHPHFAKTWEEAKEKTASIGFAFSPGNYQWQGECRASVWFPYQGEPIEDAKIVATMIEPLLQHLAPIHGLAYDKDISIGVSRMLPSEKNGNLAIVSIKGNKEGKIDKGRAAELCTGSWCFVADGFGDLPLSLVTKKKQGIVIGIEGNLDIAEDANTFLSTAHAVLKNPKEFSEMLYHTATHIEHRQAFLEE